MKGDLAGKINRGQIILGFLHYCTSFAFILSDFGSHCKAFSREET
jgi:hypothetical protein